MDFETYASIVFVAILSVFLLAKRKKLDTKFIIPYFLYFSMYKAKWGLKFMDSFARKFRKLVQYVGYFGVFVGFLGMIFISYFLIKDLIPAITEPASAAGVGLVLPIKAKGIFYVPFFYWIISIFVIAVVHEFAHGLVSRAHNIKVKSSGFAFLGAIVPIIPAAFVEPDEKELRKRPHSQQLSVFAAGPLSNILTAFACIILLLFVLTPAASGVFENDGVKIIGHVQGNHTFPAEEAGIGVDEVIKEIDNEPVFSVENLSNALRAKKPGDFAVVTTDSSSYNIKLASNPDNGSMAFMGATLEQNTKIKANIKARYGEFLPNSLIWIYGLFVILIILNLGIGLFNLVPLGPLDGGRMLQLPLIKYFGKEKGNKVFLYVSLVFLMIVVFNIGAGFGLFNFLK